MEIQVFNFNESQVRTITKDGEPWFVAADVGEVLGLTQMFKHHLSHLDEDEKGQQILLTPGGPQKMNVINESGVYGLAFRSRKPQAKQFRRWVTHEVLPSIRKHGGYMTPTLTQQALTDPSALLPLLEASVAQLKALQSRCEVQENLIGDLGNSVKELQPAAEYAGRIMDSRKLMPTNIIAKQLGMGAVMLNRKLKDMGIQYMSGGCWVLTAKYQDVGYAQIVTHTITRSTGIPDTVKQLKWTEKGQRFLLELLAPF